LHQKPYKILTFKGAISAKTPYSKNYKYHHNLKTYKKNSE